MITRCYRLPRATPLERMPRGPRARRAGRGDKPGRASARPPLVASRCAPAPWDILPRSRSRDARAARGRQRAAAAILLSIASIRQQAATYGERADGRCRARQCRRASPPPAAEAAPAMKSLRAMLAKARPFLYDDARKAIAPTLEAAIEITPTASAAPVSILDICAPALPAFGSLAGDDGGRGVTTPTLFSSRAIR